MSSKKLAEGTVCILASDANAADSSFDESDMVWLQNFRQVLLHFVDEIYIVELSISVKFFLCSYDIDQSPLISEQYFENILV